MSQFRRKLVRVAASIAVVIISVAFVLSSAPRARADDLSADPRVQRGLVIAPVPLNLQGKDQALVGLGSYFVNAMASCNDCHSLGPQTQFLPGGNPAFGQPSRTNPATYMGGGRDFGPLIPGSAPIVSRNLTPGKSGQPEGDHTLAEFMDIFRTGLDPDKAHPTCTGAPNVNCIPAPFKGDLLQIMPWFNYKDLTDQDIGAIYEYLSAIPCIEGGPGESANRCSPASARVFWIQPGSLAGFGDRNSLIVAGNALGPVPAGTRVTLYWQDKTLGTPPVAVPFTALPNPQGIWFNQIPAASVNFGHQYVVYAVYNGAISTTCSYSGNNLLNSCL